MTASVCSLRSRKSLRRICTTMLPPISTGISTRPMRNALVRTAARYSRRAITSVLRMVGPPVGQAGSLPYVSVGVGDADEDVVQRRPGQLEVAHLAALQQAG